MVQPFTQNIQMSGKPIIVKAFANWCPHCANMKPLFEELSSELGTKYTFTEFDVDESSDLTKQFNITSLPTFIFIKNKKEVGREIGEMSKQELAAIIQKYLGQ